MGETSSHYEASEGDLPFPESWGAVPIDHAALSAALDGISALTLNQFMEAQPGLPELEASAWEFDKFLRYAAVAIKRDARLNKVVPIMVPKQVPEEEFWRLYFCHAHSILQSGAEDVHDEFQPLVLTGSLLQAGDDKAINALVSWFECDGTFQMLACKQFEEILQQDKEESVRAAAGLRMAVARGLIPAKPEVEPAFSIDVSQYLADEVAAMVIQELGDATEQGRVLVVNGLDGTGKTTLINKLRKILPRTVCWSDDNLFRALTLLALQQSDPRSHRITVEALTPEVLSDLLSSLSFGIFNEKYDIQIVGSDSSVLVSEIADTVLREARLEENLSIITQLMRGEVIKFSADAVEVMRASGLNVLIAGRAQMLNYIPTAHRFELTIPDPLVLGGRQVARRLLPRVLQKLKGKPGLSSQEVGELAQKQLLEMEPPMLSQELFAEGGDATISAIVGAFERNLGFLDLVRSQSEGRAEPTGGRVRQAAMVLQKRAYDKIMKLDIDAAPEEVCGVLQRELDLMTAL